MDSRFFLDLPKCFRNKCEPHDKMCRYIFIDIRPTPIPPTIEIHL